MDSPHLLLITLGPVQEFIRQARRTRDLWFGSMLLSEVSRAAARALAEGEARLIFPSLERGDDELLPCDGPLRSGRTDDMAQPPFSVTNRILAEVPAGLSAETLARDARNAANQRWSALAARVQHKCRELIAKDIETLWQEQIETFLEFAAAWVPYREEDDSYRVARAEVEAALVGRKMLRDFKVWQHRRHGAPMSSLDGARQSILRRSTERDATLVRRYRIGEGEQLDAVGLVKRAGGEPGQFVPVGNIAFAAWIEAIKPSSAPALNELSKECHEAGIGGIHRDFPWVKRFPFDALIFLRSRWQTILMETGYLIGQPTEPVQNEKAALKWGEHFVNPILEGMREPWPYVAVLVADGDHMGRILDSIVDAEQQRRFTQHLSGFAADAREVVEIEHRGVLIYSGGDDVLALLCVTDALSCAQALHDRFKGRMARALRESLGREAEDVPVPTLSIGIGIGHVLESLGDLLELGRRAEGRAKDPGPGEGQERNGLAIVLDKRSGGQRVWRTRWDDEPGPVRRLRADLKLLGFEPDVALGPRLSHKKIFDIARDLERFPDPDVLLPNERREWGRVLARDVERTLARSDELGDLGHSELASRERLEPVDVGLDLEASFYPTLYRSVRRWVDRLLIGRAFGAALVAASPKETSAVEPTEDATHAR